ncbi:MAG: zinc ribbon domain-containing protein, partial [Candidatus Pacebacteria bacterium]|nr:zinc ribbon domain-containing protein [Candidatus Paceibacterota bacterium]
CGHCGCSITADRKHKSVKSINGYKDYIYYHCTHKRKQNPCPEKPINLESLEKQILDELDKYSISKGTTD